MAEDATQTSQILRQALAIRYNEVGVAVQALDLRPMINVGVLEELGFKDADSVIAKIEEGRTSLVEEPDVYTEASLLDKQLQLHLQVAPESSIAPVINPAPFGAGVDPREGEPVMSLEVVPDQVTITD